MFWGAVIVVALLLVAYVITSQREAFTTQLQPLPKNVRYIKLFSNTYLQISQLKVMSGNVNVAEGKKANATSEIIPGMAKFAVDGTAAARSFPDIYESNDSAASFEVDLGQAYPVDAVIYYNRKDCCADRARSMVMTLYDSDRHIVGDHIYFTSEDLEQEFVFKPVSINAKIAAWKELPGKYAGRDITSVDNSTPEACKTLCSATPGCAGALFAKGTYSNPFGRGSYNNTCWIKDVVGNASSDPNMTFYVPEGTASSSLGQSSSVASSASTSIPASQSPVQHSATPVTSTASPQGTLITPTSTREPSANDDMTCTNKSTPLDLTKPEPTIATPASVQSPPATSVSNVPASTSSSTVDPSPSSSPTALKPDTNLDVNSIYAVINKLASEMNAYLSK